MTITKEQVEKLADKNTPNTETGSLNYRSFAHDVEAAVIESLLAGVEMPEPAIRDYYGNGYTADQMREYAAAAVAREKKATVERLLKIEKESDLLCANFDALTAERDALLAKDQLASYRDAILADAEIDFRSSGNKK